VNGPEIHDGRSAILQSEIGAGGCASALVDISTWATAAMLGKASRENPGWQALQVLNYC
jgi:hypothetical protein